MEDTGKLKILIDLEKLNTLNAEGCLACGKKFSLGEEVVLARGKWEGFKYIHENEARLDKKTNTHYERGYYAATRETLPDQG
ncbi:MAG: hypothetical protein HWN51_07505 [Desulfobacterales bacterium]|nr:hypothetical protein [Desulfobacterales bacterium]